MIDSSDNINQTTVYITILDDIAPIITGPINVTTSYTEAFTMNHFLSMLEVSDNVDDVNISDIQIVEETYTSSTSLLGSYYIDFMVVDDAGNIGEHRMNVHVIDDQAPIIYIDDYLITVSPNATFTSQDAVNLLINNQEIAEKEYQVTVLFNEYEGNENIPGTYRYSVKLEDEE
jgi:hypothetical protein